jgi:quercetin dioxygenase-like cupin family protein
MRPYALKAGEGWTYRYDIDFTVKAGELRPGRGAALIEYTTQKGEEPPVHTHASEDEIFYVLQGELTFRCGDQTFEVGEGGFIYLPQGIEHGYTIRSDGPVRLLVLTFPPGESPGSGWGGFVADMEGQGELISRPENQPDFDEADHP